MKKMMQLVSVFLMFALMTPLTTEAQSRGTSTRPSNSGSRPTASASRPSSSSASSSSRPGNMGTGSRPISSSSSAPGRPTTSAAPGNNGNHNPGNNAVRPGNNGNHNPGNPGNNNAVRPGNNGNHNPGNNGNHNPGNNNPGNNAVRPGNNGNHNFHPSNPGYTGPVTRPGNSAPRPGAVSRPVPVRPYMPPVRPYTRPVPPAGWRPYHGCPTFTGVLGLTFGTAFNLSINALINAGYTVSSYGNNMVYLSSVPMFNYTWPNATLYYNNAGSLYGSEFVYSTAYYDMSRYNQLYNSLMMQYGQPVSVSNNGNSLSVTWWGYNNGYITLNYFSDYAQNGSFRYYTTLSLGN